MLERGLTPTLKGQGDRRWGREIGDEAEGIPV